MIVKRRVDQMLNRYTFGKHHISWSMLASVVRNKEVRYEQNNLDKLVKQE